MYRTARLAMISIPLVLGIVGHVSAAGECVADPNPCFAPRSWIADFDEDPLVDEPDQWQQRGGTNPLPSYENGLAILDGTDRAWMGIDSMDHYFVGTTTVDIAMHANPGGPGDLGAGWWINMDNEGLPWYQVTIVDRTAGRRSTQAHYFR